MIEVTSVWWVGFIVFVLCALAIDLGLFHRKSHVIRPKEAGIMVSIWFAFAVLFGIGVSMTLGHKKGLEFATGYLVELSLSMDNVFIMALIFAHFHVPNAHQHRVLMWGIIGALIMRGILIGAGSALVQEFHWVLYLFGIFLLITGIKMMFFRASEEFDPEKNLVVVLARKIFPITQHYHGDRFFIRQHGKSYATPLFLVLLLIEATDLMFAVDSVPAIFAITTDPFIVYTSNVFAILGLRSMYFLLAGAMSKFHYLKLGLAFILSFVGIKMLLINVIKIPTAFSLLVIVGILGLAVLASVWRNLKSAKE
jgi:tellurite resistance protein TerC